MRRDRALPADAEAVSPIVSTILMIGLTVVLVGGILWVISGFSDEEASAATAVSWTVDDETDRLLVLGTQGHTDWSRLAIQVTECLQDTDNAVGRVGDTEATSNGRFYNEPATIDGATLNQAAAGSECGPATLAPLADAAAPIWAEDYLEFCADGGQMTAITVQLQDQVARTIIRTVTFDSWDPC